MNDFFWRLARFFGVERKKSELQRQVERAEQAGFTELEPTLKYRVFDTHVASEMGRGTTKVLLDKKGVIRLGRTEGEALSFGPWLKRDMDITEGKETQE